MLNRILKWFQAPLFPGDEDKTRSALLLNVVLNTFLVALPVLIMGVLIGGRIPRYEINIWIGWLAWLTIFGTKLIMHSGRVATAGIVTVTIIFITTTLVVYNNGTIRAPITSFYLLAIVMSGLVIHRRAILWVTSVSIGAILTFLYLERNGLLPAPTLTVTITQGITYTVAFTISSILLYLAVRRIDESLTSARRELAERKRTEERFRSLLESTPDAMVVVDSEGMILLANSQLQTMFGYTREEVLTQRVEMLMPWRFMAIHPDHRKQYGKSPRLRPMGAQLPLFALHKDGREFPVEISLSPMESDEETLIIAAIRNITDRIQAEQERESYIEELGRQNAELERFAYVVSHDLRNPLVTIKGFLGALEQDIQDGRPDRFHSDLRRIAGAADKMQTLLSELLELSRIGRIVNPPESVDLNQLTCEVVENLNARLRSKNVSVYVSPDLPSVFGDRVRLREVLENLIDNAAKYTGHQLEPWVEVGARSLDHEPIIFVKDNGLGIEPQYHTRIFGLFEKLDPSSEGTGIGLALIKRIIEFHRGKIWVESEGLGKGSMFCFTIPSARKFD